jgi:ubiquinone/menaquinone biosynthesis C-methylase UbiE
MNIDEKGSSIKNIGDNGSSIWTKYGIDHEASSNTPAEIYEQCLVPEMFEPFAKDLIQLCDVQPSDRILDVACGTCIVSRLARDYVDSSMGKVVGVDINPIMFNMARRCAAGKNIEWKEGSAISFPFPSEFFDLVICQQGLQFCSDRTKALREMNRVLVRGSNRGYKRRGKCSSYGRLVLSAWTSIKDSPGFHILEQILQETISHGSATMLQLPHSLSNSSTLVSLVRAAGFNKIMSKEITRTISFPSVEEFVVGYTNGSMLSSYFSDNKRVDDISKNKLLNRASSKLSPFVDKYTGKLSFPLSTHLIFAQKNS